MTRRQRYAVVGLGKRARSTYLPALAERPNLELVAVSDADAASLACFTKEWATDVRTYLSCDYERMLREARPDWVVITTPDFAHHDQIVAALNRNVSVLSEKPMVISAEEARSVIDARLRSSGELRVAHNLRSLNVNMEVGRLLRQRALGAVSSVAFTYHLTSGHGGSYFTRWHRHRAASGGLPITKSCHHFDLINWWLQDVPIEVFAWTTREHFLAGAPLPDQPSGVVPLDADIDDTVSALVRYGRGGVASYALRTSSTWEGYALHISGTRGSLHTTYDRGSRDDFVVTIHSQTGVEKRIVPREQGRHSGADGRMLRRWFGEERDADGDGTLDVWDAAAAVLVGDAISASAQRGAAVACNVPLRSSPALAG